MVERQGADRIVNQPLKLTDNKTELASYFRQPRTLKIYIEALVP